MSKEYYGKQLNDRYLVLFKIVEYFTKCEDYAMKGTISYILCFVAQNKELKLAIENLGWQFFFNTDICLPKNLDHLYLHTTEKFENKKVFDDLDKVNKYIILNEKSTEIFNSIANLLNTISYKQSYEKLSEMFKNDSKCFNDPNLLIKVYSILSAYKYRQPLRRFILSLFENALNSQEILEVCQRILESLGEGLF